MPEAVNIINLVELFQKTFGNKPYVIGDTNAANENGETYNLDIQNLDEQFTAQGSLLTEKVLGIDILLPVRFLDGPKLVMHLPYSVIRISQKITRIKTALPERIGTVKELYNAEDFDISVKGFLINPDRQFPESELQQFKTLVQSKNALRIDNAITNIFLTDATLQEDEQRRVVIDDWDLPEVEGGRKHVKPFTLKLSSDFVFTLELEDEP